MLLNGKNQKPNNIEAENWEREKKGKGTKNDRSVTEKIGRMIPNTRKRNENERSVTEKIGGMIRNIGKRNENDTSVTDKIGGMIPNTGKKNNNDTSVTKVGGRRLSLRNKQRRGKKRTI